MKSQAGLAGIKNRASNNLRRRICSIKSDNAVAIGGLEFCIFRIIRIHAHGVIKGLDQVVYGNGNDLEIAYHVVLVQFVGFQDEFNPAGMAVWELTFIGVLG